MYLVVLFTELSSREYSLVRRLHSPDSPRTVRETKKLMSDTCNFYIRSCAYIGMQQLSDFSGDVRKRLSTSLVILPKI